MILFLLKGITRFFCVLPLSVVLAFGRGLGFVFGRVVQYHRSDALHNVARCLPELSPCEVTQVVNRMYANLGMNVAEALRISKFSKAWGEQHIKITGFTHYETAAALNKGCIGLMGHIGNWEMQGTLALLRDLKISVIVKNLKPPELNDYVVELRAATGVTVLNRKNAFRQSLRSLRNNEVVSFFLDQNVTSEDGVFVDYFGQPACTSTGLAILAIKTGAPIVPNFSIRRPGGKHEVVMFPPIYPPSEMNDGNVLALTQECTTIIENFVREYPDQWIWLHRRWKTKPVVEGCLNTEVDPIKN